MARPGPDGDSTPNGYAAVQASPLVDGAQTTTLGSWKELEQVVHAATPVGRNWIWRGQRQDWPLTPKLYREGYLKSSANPADACVDHLRVFKSACRGRRGQSPPEIPDDLEWWALGQHNGLATPLLDWTESPFVAAFFAFERDEPPSSGMRAVYALNRAAIDHPIGADPLMNDDSSDRNARGYMGLFTPESGENSRLISQSGLLTYGPVETDVESWIKSRFKSDVDMMVFLRILIPDSGRTDLLMYLNRMNINHMSMFPDLYGAGRFSNMRLQIPGY